MLLAPLTMPAASIGLAGGLEVEGRAARPGRAPLATTTRRATTGPTDSAQGLDDGGGLALASLLRTTALVAIHLHLLLHHCVS